MFFFFKFCLIVSNVLYFVTIILLKKHEKTDTHILNKKHNERYDI